MLSKDILIQQLRTFIDQEYSGFTGFPKDITFAVAFWAGAIDIYASAVLPASTTTQQAKHIFQQTILGLDTMTGNGLSIIPTAFMAYANALALGMAGFTAIAPPIPLDISTVVALGLGGGKSIACINLFANIVHTWFLTGTAVNQQTQATVMWS